MANPVAINATSIELPSRRAGAADNDSARIAGRGRGVAYPRLVYEAQRDPSLERLRHAEMLRDARARPRDTGQGQGAAFAAFEDESEILREAGRRKAPAGLSFTAQQIAQERLSPGLYFEDYKPAIAAYARASAYGEPSAAPGAMLRMLV